MGRAMGAKYLVKISDQDANNCGLLCCFLNPRLQVPGVRGLGLGGFKV